VAVASAGLYASLHLIPDNHANIPPLSFLQACRPTNSVKALKATVMSMYRDAKTVVRTVYGNSSCFEVKVGMHQGPALS